MRDSYWRNVGMPTVVDGDTIKLTPVDLGYHVTVEDITYRLARINCPESGTPEGAKATAYTMQWLIDHLLHAPPFMNFMFSVQSTKTDNWRRYIAEFECYQGHNLSDDLLTSGNAVRYKHG